MLEILKYNSNIGLITKEIILDELNKKELIPIETSFEIKPIEYGMYINKENKFRELINLVDELKESFI